MDQILKILKYEFLNVFRNKWILFYGALLLVLSLALIWVGGSFSKAILSLANLIVVLIPLVSLLFTVVYWYYNEKYTEMLLAQPISRPAIFFARWIAISLSQSVSVLLGLLIPFIFFKGVSGGVLLNIMIGILLTWTFVAIGIWISIFLNDRMKGVGFALSMWLFFVLVYDGLILLLLIGLKEYPLDVLSGLLGVLNPIGLSRVILLVYHNGSLLLGYTGTLVRNFILSPKGISLAFIVGFIWLLGPVYGAYRKMLKKDF